MKLLLTGAYNYSDTQLEQIKSLRYDIIYIQDERIPLTIDTRDIDAVVCNGLFQYNDIQQFTNLKYIQLTSAGTDRVPMEYITIKNIQLKTARGVYSAPIAEWVLLKVLEIYKKSHVFMAEQRKHNWNKQRDLKELTGKTAAIIGMGSVGLEVAKRFKAFDVNVWAVDNRIPQLSEIIYITKHFTPDKLIQVLQQSDIVVLTLPLTSETMHLIDVREIAAMKHDAVLINVSRGGIINEESLITALKSGKYSGVALDVFDEEPLPANSLLWDMKQVNVSPHNSFVSDRTSTRLFELIFSNFVSFINEKNG